LASATVTPENGWTRACEVVSVVCVPAMVGATAGSLSITVVVLFTVAVA
jgi:hypothetical protein